MKWFEQKERIRRFLRDPDGNIWSDSLLLRLYNHAQQETAGAYGVLEEVDVIRIPPIFQACYLYDWEWKYSSPAYGWTYQTLTLWDQGGYVHSSRWEPEHITSNIAGNASNGDNWTHPWEAFMVSSSEPDIAPPVWFPDGFDKAVGVYWDKLPIIPTTKKELQKTDRTWRTRQGAVQFYYRGEKLENYFYLYPMPESVDWDDIVQQIQEAGYVSTGSWDDVTITDYYNVEYLCEEDTTNDRWHTFSWEENYTGDPTGDWTNSTISSDLFHDSSILPNSQPGVALWDSDADESSDFGVIVDEDGSAVTTDKGSGTDIIDPDGQLLVISKKTPKDLAEEDDESMLPSYLQKYTEYGVLEQAFRANTDGYIPSLADYWQMRKEIGFGLIRSFKSKRRTDRTYVMQTHDIPARNVRRRPKLPDTYPAVW